MADISTENPVNPNAICGHCGKPRSQHFFEDEVYCFDNTNGDIWRDEPSVEQVAEMIEETSPDLWNEFVIKWKKQNGHL